VFFGVQGAAMGVVMQGFEGVCVEAVASRAGVSSGELRADAGVEVALLALTGTVIAKERAGPGAALDGKFAERVVDELMLGLAAR
jgi:hypothetical protein